VTGEYLTPLYSNLFLLKLVLFKEELEPLPILYSNLYSFLEANRLITVLPLPCSMLSTTICGWAYFKIPALAFVVANRLFMFVIALPFLF
jgi:hypothetical protein